MKYQEKSKFPKFIGITGLYGIIALSLILVGAISWFTLARKNSTTKINEGNSSGNKNSSYWDEHHSYNSIKEEFENLTPNTQSTAESKEDIPYEEQNEKPLEIKQSFVMPIKGIVVKDYNDSALQYSATYGDMRLHLGIDIECEKNTTVSSCSSGTVTDITDNALLGKTVIINHGNGITVKYCGMGTINVKQGAKVEPGTELGTIGTVPSECADKIHLHVEVLKDGVLVSPLKALGFE